MEEFVEYAAAMRPCMRRARREKSADLTRLDSLAIAMVGASSYAQFWHSHNEARLLRHGFDTLILLQQPQNKASGAWATEIWDVRHGRSVFTSVRSMEASRLLRTLDGGRCDLKPLHPGGDGWAQCVGPCEAGHDSHPCRARSESLSRGPRARSRV